MIRLELETPPSVNKLFATDWKTKRRFKSKEYERWLASANVALMLTKYKPIIGPVNVTITIEDTGRVDLANHEKACVDFCVKHGLIEDDTRPILRRLLMQWGRVKGCLVEIEPVK